MVWKEGVKKLNFFLPFVMQESGALIAWPIALLPFGFNEFSVASIVFSVVILLSLKKKNRVRSMGVNSIWDPEVWNLIREHFLPGSTGSQHFLRGNSQS